MAKKTLKALVSGIGRIAWQFHLPAMQSNEKIEVLAVSDPLPERCSEAMETYGVPRSYESFEAMLAGEPEADFLVLTSPTCFHREQAIAAMERGLDIFCEKPLAGSLRDAEEMVAVMRKLGRKIMVYQPHRIRPEALSLQDILTSGLLGEVFMTRRVCAHFSRRNDWQSQRKLGGGMLNNYGAHFIDQFMFIFGREPYRVGNCELRRVVSFGDADDVAKITLVAGNGIIGDIDINMASPFTDHSWRVFGSRGEAVMEKDHWKVKYVREEDLPALPLQNSLAAAKRSYASEGALPWQETSFAFPHKDDNVFYDYVYDHFALDRPSFVPIETTLELMRINAECREIAEKNHPLAGDDESCGCS